MHVTNWATAQKEDPELDAVLQWLGSRKRANLRTLLGECIMSKEGQMVWRNCQNFISLQGTLYLCSTPKGEDEDLLLFVVPKVHLDCHPKWMSSEMQDTKAVTIISLCCKNIFGGQEWPNK